MMSILKFNKKNFYNFTVLVIGDKSKTLQKLFTKVADFSQALPKLLIYYNNNPFKNYIIWN